MKTLAKKLRPGDVVKIEVVNMKSGKRMLVSGIVVFVTLPRPGDVAKHDRKNWREIEIETFSGLKIGALFDANEVFDIQQKRSKNG